MTQKRQWLSWKPSRYSFLGNGSACTRVCWRRCSLQPSYTIPRPLRHLPRFSTPENIAQQPPVVDLLHSSQVSTFARPRLLSRDLGSLPPFRRAWFRLTPAPRVVSSAPGTPARSTPRACREAATNANADRDPGLLDLLHIVVQDANATAAAAAAASAASTGGGPCSGRTAASGALSSCRCGCAKLARRTGPSLFFAGPDNLLTPREA